MRRIVRRRSRSAVLATVACLGLLFPGAFAANASAAGADDPSPFGCHESNSDPSHDRFTVCTNDVTGRSASDAVVVDELTRLVDRADGPSDQIRISMFQWWYQTTGNTSFDYQHLYALTHAVIDAATKRDVDVRILIDDISDPAKNSDLDVPGLTQPFTELTQALGSRVTVCGEDSGCLRNGNDNAINHNKFFLLDIDGTEHVVLTSTNLVPWAQIAYENLVHIRWDGKLYDFLHGYWERLQAGSWEGWTTAADREHLGSVVPADGRVETKGFVFPRYDKAANDPILQMLNGITACPDSSDRKIWVSMSMVTMARIDQYGILDRIGQLSGMGCAVKFLVNQGTPADVLQALRGEGAQVVTVPREHHKFIVVDATSRGMDGQASAPREFVWTGSHNLSWASAWRDGEAAAWVEQHEVVRAYVSHFECVWDRNRVDGGNDDDGC